MGILYLRRQIPAATTDQSTFILVEYIPVTAQGGVSAPFVTGKRHKTARFIEGTRGVVYGRPEVVGDLKIIALMATDIKQAVVPRKGEIVVNRIRADRLFGLPMYVRPIPT